jgi:hypothetical protein
MTDRENSPAYQLLPQSARRVFAAIEAAIGNRSSASVSYEDFRLDHHIGRPNISPAVKLLDHLGLIEVEPVRASSMCFGSVVVGAALMRSRL